MANGLSIREVCMNDLKRFACFTTADEQSRLGQMYRANGLTEDRNLLVGTGVMWAVKLSYQFARAYNCHCFLMDLVQEAMLGLIRAAEKYDPSIGRFSTFATIWIRAKLGTFIIDHAQDIRLPIDRINKLRHLRTRIEELTKELGRDPTDDEIMTTGLSKRVITSLRQHAVVRVRSLSDVLFEGRDGRQTTLADIIPDTRQMEESVRGEHSEDNRKRIVEFVQRKFKPKVATSFILYYGLGEESEMTLDEAGKRDGVTREMVRQRIGKVLGDPSFKWFMMKTFGSETRIAGTKEEEENLRDRLHRQSKLAQESAVVPAVSEIKRRVKKEGFVPEVTEKVVKAITAEVQMVVTQVIDATEKYYDLPAGVLQSSSRNRQISYARKVAGQIIRDVTGLTWDQIGQVFRRNGVFFNTASLEMRYLIREDANVRRSYETIRSSLDGLQAN